MRLAYQFAVAPAAPPARRSPGDVERQLDERGRSGARNLQVHKVRADVRTARVLQALLEYLRIALIVVQRRALLGQACHRAGLKAAFAEPVCGTGGEHEQRGQRPRPGLGLDMFEQLITPPAMAVVRVN